MYFVYVRQYCLLFPLYLSLIHIQMCIRDRSMIVNQQQLDPEGNLKEIISLLKKKQKLLSNDIIEPSRSLCEANLLLFVITSMRNELQQAIHMLPIYITSCDQHPKIEDTVLQVTKYEIFSTIELSSAYYQIPNYWWETTNFVIYVLEQLMVQSVFTV